MLKKIFISELHRVAPMRRPGYLEACMKIGTVSGEHVIFTEEQFESIRAAFNIGMNPPPILKRAANLSKAIARSAVNVISRKQPLLENSEEAARRLAICKRCEKFDPQMMICTHANCGCFLRIKTYLRAEHCPLNPPKW